MKRIRYCAIVCTGLLLAASCSIFRPRPSGPQEPPKPFSREEAMALAGETAIDAICWQKDGKNHVLALDKGLELRMLSADGKLEYTRSIPVYTLADETPLPSMLAPIEIIDTLGSRSYLHLEYLNGDSEYVEALYLPEEDIVNQVMFYGSPVQRSEGEAYRIEGTSPEFMEGLNPTFEVLWLTGRLKENPSLIEISKADLLTDNSIRWWLEKNPSAESGASRLYFGQLDPESSIVAAYKKARKEKGKSSSAALFDIRGYTVVVASNRATGDCSLVWCEPVCKNRKRDKFLNNIYFEGNGTTLVLYWYKGSTTFKYRISLASQTVSRSK